MKFRKLFDRKKRHLCMPRANAFVLESPEPRLLLSATPMTAAVVTTDHQDYAPGETAVITTSNQAGDGLQFGAGELVQFQVTRTDGMADYVGSTTGVGPAGNEAWYVVDGVGGFTAHLGSDVSGDGVADWIAPDNDLTVNSSISTTWFVEEQYRNSSLVVTAQGQESGAVATHAFTDADINTITMLTSSAPSGADKTITINEDEAYTFSVADFGFTDLNDSPANDFQAVTITTVPVVGTLTLNGTPVQAGDSITLPPAGETWTARESNRDWISVASSADGTKLVAAAWGGQLYTSVPQPLGLVYTPPANANGNSLAQVTFQVQDSGGTANGGVNLDPTPNTITFNVTPVYDAYITTTSVDSSAATSTYGDSVTFSAIVTTGGGSGTPTGSVEFFDGATSLGAGAAASTGAGTSTWSITTGSLTAGTHSIHAVFTGTVDIITGDGFIGSTSNNIIQTVSQKILTGNFTVTNKVYDATTAATVETRTLTGVLAGDTVNLTGGTATFNNANAGTGKTVTLAGATLSGVAAGNYSLTSVNTTTADIAKANATITLVSYVGTYDGFAHQATGQATGILGETLSGLNMAVTSHTNAGVYIDTVTFTDVTGNYKNTIKNVKSTINKANAVITVTGYSVIFDGLPHTATGTATGVLGEDLSAGLDLSSTTHTNVGTYIDTVTFTDVTGNYKNTVKNVSSRIL